MFLVCFSLSFLFGIGTNHNCRPAKTDQPLTGLAPRAGLQLSSEIYGNMPKRHHTMYIICVYLVGGLEHFYLSIQLGMLSSLLTFIFFRRIQNTNHIYIYYAHVKSMWHMDRMGEYMFTYGSICVCVYIYIYV